MHVSSDDYSGVAQVYPGKEDRFCEFMRYKMLDMPGVFDAETGQVVPRRAEFSIPTKTIKVFSEKSLKWSSKAIGYKVNGLHCCCLQALFPPLCVTVAG